jgi:hypothetical protein
MSHLTDLEIVELIDGALDAPRASHLATCDACRTKIDDLRGALARAKEVDVPEPSPLFWEHFAARVRAGLDDVQQERRAWWSWSESTRWKWSVPGVVLAVLLAAGAWRVFVHTPSDDRTVETIANRSTGAPTTGGPVSAPDPGALGSEAADADEAWAIVRSVADEVEWNDGVTAGLAVRPGWVERAALDLSRDERDELVRLLQAEVKRPGA